MCPRGFIKSILLWSFRSQSAPPQSITAGNRWWDTRGPPQGRALIHDVHTRTSAWFTKSVPNVAANARGLTRVGYTKLGAVHNVSRLSLQISLYQHNESGVCAKFDLSEAFFGSIFVLKCVMWLPLVETITWVCDRAEVCLNVTGCSFFTHNNIKNSASVTCSDKPTNNF